MSSPTEEQTVSPLRPMEQTPLLATRRVARNLDLELAAVEATPLSAVDGTSVATTTLPDIDPAILPNLMSPLGILAPTLLSTIGVTGVQTGTSLPQHMATTSAPFGQGGQQTIHKT